ncbi:MAG: hypothetical protein AAGE52_13740 [Myxococcota bacterium]
MPNTWTHLHRSFLHCALVLSLPTLASADVIRPYPGECPPGQRTRIQNHRESCAPIDCASESCPDGSACMARCRCVEDREVRIRRVRNPVVRSFLIGACRADNSCTEGRAVEYQPCEATEESPPPTSMEVTEDEPAGPEPARTQAAEAKTAPTETPAESGTPAESTADNCSVGGRPSGLAAHFVAVLLLRRRFRG